MKNKVMILLLALSCNALAQSEAGNKEKMKIFASWAGRWKGEGSMQMGPGEPKKSMVDEKIEPKFDGMIYLVEGIGKMINPETKQETVVHHAFAVLSYDQYTNQYKFRTYLKDGRSTDAWFNPMGENKFQWGFDIPNRGKTRYTITIDATKKTWNEIGEFSANGTEWNSFFEMNLTKVE